FAVMYPWPRSSFARPLVQRWTAGSSAERSLCCPGRRYRPWLPLVGFLQKAEALGADDAKTLPRRRLHHYPTFQATGHLGAQGLQASHLGRDIVRFNVEVHAA